MFPKCQLTGVKVLFNVKLSTHRVRNVLVTHLPRDLFMRSLNTGKKKLKMEIKNIKLNQQTLQRVVLQGREIKQIT